METWAIEEVLRDEISQLKSDRYSMETVTTATTINLADAVLKSDRYSMETRGFIRVLIPNRSDFKVKIRPIQYGNKTTFSVAPHDDKIVVKIRPIQYGNLQLRSHQPPILSSSPR